MPIYPYSFQLPPLNVQDIPNNGAVGEFLGISAGGVLDWLPVASGGGDMLKSENLSGLADYPTARTNLGLGTGDSPTFKNLTISTGTITTSAPVTISQTWNAVAQTFKALVVNAAGTSDANSASGSLLLDLQLNGVSKIYARKDGTLIAPTQIIAGTTGNGGQTVGVVANGIYLAGGTIYGPSSQFVIGPGTGISQNSVSYIAWGNGASSVGTVDTILLRDGAANTLALRNGTNAQTFNVYGTYTSGSAYARLAIACDTSGNATLTTQSTGTAGTLSINGVPVGRGKGSVSYNVAVGSGSLGAITSGQANTAIGDFALNLNTAANDMVAVGLSSFYNITSGSNSVAIGNQAGRYFVNSSGLATNSTSSIYIGYGASLGANATTNEIVIGAGAVGLGSNTAVLGNSSITTTALRGNVGIGTTAPTQKLDVAGAVSAGSSTNGYQLTNGTTRVSGWGNNQGSNGGLGLSSTFVLGWASGVDGGNFGLLDTILLRDAANTLALRNSTNAQTFNIYNTYTDGSNYSRLSFLHTGGQATIVAEGAGTGVAGSHLTLKAAGASRSIIFNTGTVDRWLINSSGHFIAQADNTYDIGASGANRPRTIYAGSGINAGSGSSSILSSASAIAYNLTGGVYGGTSQFAFFAPSDGVLRLTNGATTDFNRMQFGGTTASFPAIKRNSTGLDIRLADDSGFAPLAASSIDLPSSAAASAVQQLTVGRIVYAGEGYRVGNNYQVVFSNGADYARGIATSSSGGLAITNGTTGGQSLQFVEMTAPAAPATNGVRIYAEDNGSGKTRLMALFATGVAQQIAIEP